MGCQERTRRNGSRIRFERFVPVSWKSFRFLCFIVNDGRLVVLDCHPFITTLVILAGWVCKTGVVNVANNWVGEENMVGEAWLAYSIP